MTTNIGDPYLKLRASPPTPEDEICRCKLGAPVKLVSTLSNNPVQCLMCRGEVPPERIGFGADLGEAISVWRHTHDALYRLWLGSGEYETWAAEKLGDPNGEVNVEGLKIAVRLNEFVSAYFYWFAADEDKSLRHCPVCRGELGDSQDAGLRVCAACKILVAGR